MDWVNLSKSRIVKLAAEFANNFNMLGGTPESYKERMKILDEYCREIGRDPREIRRSWQGFVNITSQKQSIEETIKNLRAMEEAGVQDFLLALRDRTDIAALESFAERVIPVFK